MGQAAKSLLVSISWGFTVDSAHHSVFNRLSTRRPRTTHPMKKHLLLTSAVALLTTAVHAQILISTNAGNAYSQNFDSLATTGSGIAWANNTTLPGWYAGQQSGTLTTYRTAGGELNAGALYSFGTNGVGTIADRTLGSVSSGTPNTIAYGIRIQNDTADVVTNILVSYTGEQWRNGGNASAQTLTFWYRTNSVAITSPDPNITANWNAVTALDFVTPIVGATATILDGNAPANRAALTNVRLTDLALQPGHELFLRWYDINDGGNDHGFGVDDFSITYTREVLPITGPSISPDPVDTTAAVWTAPSLSAAASGTPPLYYFWMKDGNFISDGGNVSGTKSNVLSFAAVMHANAGQYRLVVSNQASMATSAPANLTVVGFAITPVTTTNTLTATPVVVGFSFVDNQTPITTVTGTSGNQTLLPDANISVSPTGNDRTVTLTPAAAQNGVALVTVSASDGSYSTNLTFPLIVVPSASVVLNDYFDYPDGSLTTNSGFLWQNHGNTFGDLQVVSSQTYLSRSATEDVHADLIGQPFTTNNPGSLYARFTVNFSNTDTPTAAGSYFAHFKDAAFGFRARVWASTNATGNLRLGIGNGSNADANSGMFPLDLSYNTPYTVVARIDLHDGTSTLWVNPTSQTDTSVTANDGQSTTNGINVVSFALRQNSGISKLFFDDLVIATSFDAATGLTTTPPTAPTLALTPSGGNVILSWPNPVFLLQSASSVTGPYTAVLGASSPYSTGPTNAQKYFRLKY